MLNLPNKVLKTIQRLYDRGPPKTIFAQKELYGLLVNQQVVMLLLTLKVIKTNELKVNVSRMVNFM